ncbi:beta-galactosidase [Plantibacter sp. LMC-P-059a]|uniref:glycoside hydrolase family 35 protein n=1 Tax=Plantibacter sp. LMC-P-059a TaxID=3040297 RepID=UPI00254DA6CF|nr:beta-galactosidase [Plantibacter sp. LMC-P-059a]
MTKFADAVGSALPHVADEPQPALPAALHWHDGELLRNGVPHSIRSGSLHYFRVVPEHWRDRMLRFVDLGLNSIDTYIPWNFHQPQVDVAPEFTGWRDIGRFMDTAADLGLDVLLRPGPYICAEWSNGGLPAWLTARDIALRSSDPGYQQPVETWFEELIPRLAPYQAVHGGPVVAVQVENEYGSYGDDARYPGWLASLLRRLGVQELLYTADGPTDLMIDGGSIPGIMMAATLGSKPDEARALLRSRRPDEPFFVAEFWNGWFDHWGQPHHVRDADNAAEVARGILADGGSISIYMAHGGTNFGLWSGANVVDGELRPTITSYDSDAPIAEDGRLTPKFFALREALGKADQPLRSPELRYLPERSVPLQHGAGLLDALGGLGGPLGERTASPAAFEDLDVDGGLVVFEADVLLPDRPVDLVFDGVADRALVFLDGEHQATITAAGTVTVIGTGLVSKLTVVVENLGRVNYGPQLGSRKGLLGPVLVERRLVHGWRARPVALDRLDALHLRSVVERSVIERSEDGADSEGVDDGGLSSGTFHVDEPLDTHLRLPGFTKGFVWINGALLGRYWNIGPQQTLYVPGPLLRSGSNRIVVLELHRSGSRVELVSHPELGPTEEYVEEF